MTSYRITEHELSTARFGVSELSESVLSLRVLRHPDAYPHLRRWRAQVAARLEPHELDVLLALVAADHSTPDLLNPRPAPVARTFDEELRDVLARPVRILERDLDAIHPDGRPPALDGLSGEHLRREVVTHLHRYRTHALWPWWARMRTVLRADLATRSRSLASSGVRGTVGRLTPTLTVGADTLETENPNGPWFDADARGRGLVFVPSLFTPHASYPFSEEEPPYLLYPAARPAPRAGSPAGSASGSADEPDRLVRLLGRSRAAALLEVVDEATSTTVAARLGITTSAANQQLRWLLAAGLVEAERNGRVVVYRPSTIGAILVHGDHPA